MGLGSDDKPGRALGDEERRLRGGVGLPPVHRPLKGWWHSPDLVLVPSEPYDFQPGHLDELRPIAPVVEVDGKTHGKLTPTNTADVLAGYE